MPRGEELSNNEKEFILAALEKDIRTDGRPFDAYRNLAITFGENYGSVDVSLGDTRYA
jgi:exosome complex component RRP45